MKNKIAFAFIFIILFRSTILFSSEFTGEIGDAFLVLCETYRFHMLPVDEHFEPFEEIKAFRCLLNERSADIFITLFMRAKENEGKLYALVGLYLIGDKEKYFILKTRLEDFIVLVSYDDISSHERTDYVFDKLENGKLTANNFWLPEDLRGGRLPKNVLSPDGPDDE
jgi:hypothetical protein